jgi:hypothetical protein
MAHDHAGPALRRSRHLRLVGRGDGEKRLMLAVLEDALFILLAAARLPSQCRRARYRETLDWILSDDRTWPFSFLRVCEALDIDPDRLRGELAPWLSPLARGAASPTPGRLPN